MSARKGDMPEALIFENYKFYVQLRIELRYITV
jgi:hypothetical protein